MRPRPETALAEMATLAPKVPHAGSVEELLGMEGAIAAKYFGRFGDLLRPPDFDAEWDFEGRNRRPPNDPVNALLSFGYALLTKECTVALLAEGLDPWWGLFHQPRHGRPALALDLIEEFRAVVVDSAVITAINTGKMSAGDFNRSAAACVLDASGRKAFIRAYEARLDHLVTHPSLRLSIFLAQHDTPPGTSVRALAARRRAGLRRHHHALTNMSERRHYLVTYDISDDKPRTAVFETLSGYGNHAQYSVFFCELNTKERVQLRSRLRSAVNTRDDQVLIVDLGLATTPLESGIEAIGRGYDPPVRTVVI